MTVKQKGYGQAKTRKAVQNKKRNRCELLRSRKKLRET